MKEATGELSSAIIVVICVAILIAFFSYTIWPIIKNNFDAQTSCDKAICKTIPDDDGTVTCYMPDKNGKATSKEIKCNFKG